ncbi:flavin monoamine oxidase family protein [Sorangium sp. So ce388]|uniref:flavin monoamine oxidase family protein n=1 Tax=Sorangium sp. So ce388 TaxID=3133309 RepID=UPI003F5C5A79
MDDMSDNIGIDVDVVIIGGGVAGLTAAFWLKKNNMSFVLMEAQDKLGGRAETAEHRCDIDLGAAYFGPLQAYTVALCNLLKVHRINNRLPGDLEHRVELSNGGIHKFKGKSFDVPRKDVPSEDADPDRESIDQHLFDLGLLGGFFDRREINDSHEIDAIKELYKVLGELEAMVLSMRIDLQNPANNRAAKSGLDSCSVEDWMKKNIRNQSIKDLLAVGVRSALSAEPRDVSMLYLVYFAATGGSFANVMSVGGGADNYRFKHGSSTLVRKLSEQVEAKNIRLNAKVSRIQEDGDGVTIFDEHGTRVGRARRCIVAMSPKHIDGISLNLLQGVPDQRKTMAEDMKMGKTIKAFVSFKKPWWRYVGSSGYALSAKGPVVWTMDNTWPDHESAEHYTLMAFIVGDDVDHLKDLEDGERMDKIIDHWRAIFEVDDCIIRHQLATNEKGRNHHRVWFEDPSSGRRGGPGAFFPPNKFLEHWPSLRQPTGRLHWAGAETATDWVGGYINGAIQSGIRAAEEVLKEVLG